MKLGGPARLGPAVLHPDREWKEERMPIKVKLDPVMDRFITPPKEFDHEFVVKRTDEMDIKKQCRAQTNSGCAFAPVDIDPICRIWIVYDDILNYQRYSYDVVFRHERAYCNGWHHDKFGRSTN